MKRSRKYKKALEKVDQSKEYELEKALELLPNLSIANFDASIEIHVKLNIPSKHKKESIRGSTTLPHQVDEGKKIAVITTPQHQKEAEEADTVGGEDLIKKIKKGWDEFDVLIASPEIMSKVAVLGKKLGPQGKMPNPKNNTVTSNLKEVIKSYKEGKTNFRADDQQNLHMKIGKMSMDNGDVKENIETFMKDIIRVAQRYHPAPIDEVYLAPAMGPSVKVDPDSIVQ